MADTEEIGSLRLRRLPLLQRYAFGVGHVLNDLCASMWFSYLIVYFHSVLNFDHDYAGYIMLIGQVSDAFATPFIGIESDNPYLSCRYGKRKSWHLVGTIFVICSFPFLFINCFGCHNSSDWARLLYYAPFVVIFQFGWAATQVAHMSLIPDLTPDESERVELNAIRNAFTVISNICVYLITWLILGLNTADTGQNSVIPSDAPEFRNIVIIITCLGTIFSIIFHCFALEQRQEEEPNYSTSCLSDGTISNSLIKPVMEKMSWKCWFKEHQFYEIIIIYMGCRLYVNVSQVYLPMYLTKSINLRKESIAIIPLIVYCAGLILTIGMKKINKAIGRKLTLLFGCVAALGFCTWTYFDTTMDHNKIYGVAVLLGASGSVMLVTSLAMAADLIKENIESGAFVFGVMSFADKLMNGIVVMIIQYLHPDDSCLLGTPCTYYREVIVFVPGGAAVITLVSLLLIAPEVIGTRRKASKRLRTIAHINSSPSSLMGNEASETKPLLCDHNSSINTYTTPNHEET